VKYLVKRPDGPACACALDEIKSGLAKGEIGAAWLACEETATPRKWVTVAQLLNLADIGVWPAGQAPSAAQPQFLMARGLVVCFRVLALLAAIWGVLYVVNTAEAASVAVAAAGQATRMPGGMVVAQDPAVQAAARARTMAVFTAVVVALMAVAAPLCLAEVLKLALTIESNTRQTTQPWRIAASQTPQAAELRGDG
jgi:hypothetical protein